jgi:hypothetical protein
MKTIEIELSDSASAVITEMARRGKVKPEALARICLEDTLSQAVNRLTCADGDIGYLESARDPDKACRESWEEVEFAGDYATVLGRKEMPATKNPHSFRVELTNGYVLWNLNAKFRRILKPIAKKLRVSVEEFLRLYSRDELSNQQHGRRLSKCKIPAGFSVNIGAASVSDKLLQRMDLPARIARAAKFTERTVEELVWNSVASHVDCCEEDMIFSPATGEPIADVMGCEFHYFLLSSYRFPVAA